MLNLLSKTVIEYDVQLLLKTPNTLQIIRFNSIQ